MQISTVPGMVRPIYNLVFDEWYDCVDFKRISAAERASGVVHEFREKLPTFHRGFEAFLPPDIANYVARRRHAQGM